MELVLKRSYFKGGTNGAILQDGELVCFSLELPWKGNVPYVSCIPEGRYELGKRFTAARGWHLQVKAVADRSGILIHAANDAQKELEGCIAPVSYLSGIGRGLYSKRALKGLQGLVFEALEANTVVFLTIKTAGYDFIGTD